MSSAVTQVNQHAVRIAGVIFPAVNIDLHQQGGTPFTQYFELAYKMAQTGAIVYLVCAFDSVKQFWHIERYITNPAHDVTGEEYYPDLRPMLRHVVHRTDEQLTEHIAHLVEFGLRPLRPSEVWNSYAPEVMPVRECSE